eukprot:3690915-Amphidinium_carterae.1
MLAMQHALFARGAGVAGRRLLNRARLLASANHVELIALDLDGTLLQHDGTVPKRSVDALLAASKRGIRCVSATGRGPDSARRVLARTPSVLPAMQDVRGGVFMTGAYVKHPDTGDVLRSASLPPAATSMALKVAREVEGCSAVLISGSKIVGANLQHWGKWMEAQGDGLPTEIGWEQLMQASSTESINMAVIF